MDAEKIMSLLFIIPGVGILIKIASIYYFYKVTIKKWKSVEGVIISYGSEYYQSKSDVSDSGWKAGMLYSYVIDDFEYQNDAVTKNIRMIRNYAEDVELEDYKAGDRVSIYYNPSNPRKSIIDNKFSYYNLAAIIMSIIAFAVAYYSFKRV